MNTLVIIPTYNERESLPTALARTRAAMPDADILVADDNSPDGTGAIADQAAAADSRIHVMHRPGKQGLGQAYLAGFQWALDRDYDRIIEMDADGSHRPEQLPALLARAGEDDAPDLVIGSRWVPGGEVVNWPWHREVLSRGANTYVRVMLGLAVKDATAGFRVFRADALRQLRLDDIESQGYCFQVDMTLRVHRAGGVIAEVPISFVERAEGVSKMSRHIIVEALTRTTAWGLRHRAGQLAALVTRRR
ncbi:polyprenol monophosphomannose synthase [Georgenia sp. MJ173]|uniref:polyprenol monophosphomannose synthase n=1 Tax=Georgenia sunbinii TaxID=3117728 RepID=UPI002F260CC8